MSYKCRKFIAKNEIYCFMHWNFFFLYYFYSVILLFKTEKKDHQSVNRFH